MPGADSFLDDPSGSRGQLMRATYLALCTHGYADLTIQRIADEFPKSKSLIYHHYDGKDDLLLDFLEFVLECFEDEIPEAEGGPAGHLRAVLDHVLATPLPEERREFASAMVELRAQAAHDERYRAHFTRSDRFFRDRIAAIIEAGVEEGVFDPKLPGTRLSDGEIHGNDTSDDAPVDPEEVAAYLVTVVVGSLTQRVTSDDDSAQTVREHLEDYVRTVLEGDG